MYKIIVYEPNKLNPLIWLLHLIDPNERGLLSLSKNKYKQILNRHNFTMLNFIYSGIIVVQTQILSLISYILIKK